MEHGTFNAPQKGQKTYRDTSERIFKIVGKCNDNFAGICLNKALVFNSDVKEV